MTKIQNFSSFQSFYAIFVNFSKDIVIGMLERVNKEQVGCPEAFSEELTAVFKLKTISNWHRNRQKTIKISKFLCSFCQTRMIQPLTNGRTLRFSELSLRDKYIL